MLDHLLISLFYRELFLFIFSLRKIIFAGRFFLFDLSLRIRQIHTKSTYPYNLVFSAFKATVDGLLALGMLNFGNIQYSWFLHTSFCLGMMPTFELANDCIDFCSSSNALLWTFLYSFQHFFKE